MASSYICYRAVYTVADYTIFARASISMYACMCMHSFLYVFHVLHAFCMVITWPNTPVTPKATLRVPVPSNLQTHTQHKQARKHTHTHEHTQTGSEIYFAYDC